jgi:prolyl 4-hydroxylase
MASSLLGSGLDAAHVVARLQTASGVQVLASGELTLFVKRAFLPPAWCAALVEAVDAVRRPSTIADANGDAAFRTSETGDLAATLPAVQEVRQRMTELTGLDPVYAEPLQGQRYAAGQEFKAHTDYFEPSGVDYEAYCGIAGNRTWTAMVYLNEPEAGGATRFDVVDQTIQPETGMLVCWNNRRPDGSLNGASLHHGTQVSRGVKYIITQWFRERPWPQS